MDDEPGGLANRLNSATSIDSILSLHCDPLPLANFALSLFYNHGRLINSVRWVGLVFKQPRFRRDLPTVGQQC